jgi:hypothetical protein
MKFGSVKPETYITLGPVNTLLLILGLAIVWSASHSWLAVLGALVASIHIALRMREHKWVKLQDVVALVESEPELPGEPSPEDLRVFERLAADGADGVLRAARIAVHDTKDCIIERLQTMDKEKK